jgi:hypothetical protein
MDRTVVGTFSSYSEAQEVARDLDANGVPPLDISVVANDASGEYAKGMSGETVGKTGETTSGAGKGAIAGGVVGGAAGLIVGLAGIAIPGIGPVIAMGTLATTLAGVGVGAVAGGLIGALTQAGVPEEEAGTYAEAVRRGNVLVTVRTDESRAQQVADIMNKHDAIDVDREAKGWREAGWSGFDPNAAPLTVEEVNRERGLARTADQDRALQESSAKRTRIRIFGTDDAEARPIGSGRTSADADYREHFLDTYASAGAVFEDYVPAYQYGTGLSENGNYRGRTWADIAPDVQHDWERTHEGSAWERFKAAIRHGWERSTAAVDRATSSDTDRVTTRRTSTY